MDEVQITAQIAALVEQRNAAMNQVVNLTGALAVANAKINALTVQVEAMTSAKTEEPEASAAEENPPAAAPIEAPQTEGDAHA